MGKLVDEMEIEIHNGSTSYVIRERKIPDACKAPVPKILISTKARLKAFAMCKIVIDLCTSRNRSKSEAFAFCIGEEMGRIDDIIMPKQSASYVSVNVGTDHVQECIARLKEINADRVALNAKISGENTAIQEKNKEIEAANVVSLEKNFLIDEENIHRIDEGIEQLPREEIMDLIPEKLLLNPLYITGWTHSHVDFHVFTSGTDNHEHEYLHNQLIFTQLINKIPDDVAVPRPFYIVGITVNALEQEYPVVYESMPCGYRVQYENKAVTVDEFGPQLTDDEMREIVRAMYQDIKTKMIFDSSGRERESPRFLPYPHVEATTITTPSRASTLNEFLKDISTSRKDEKKEKGIFDQVDEIVAAFSSKDTWGIVSDDKIMEKLFSEIQEMIVPASSNPEQKQDLDNLNDSVKGKIMEMLHHEHDVLAEALSDIISSASEEDDHDEDDYEFCAVCKDVLTDDNRSDEEDNDGNPVCKKCIDKLCPSCGSHLIGNNVSNQVDEDMGRPLCRNCVDPDQEDDEIGNLDPDTDLS